ncbi:MAG: hypothetical protein AAFW89_01180 [Bacteroidota bacterium]
MKASIFTLGLLLILGSCARDEDQVDFEAQALQRPANFTETNANKEVISLDEDDWRISPLYIGNTVDPAYPNPVELNDRVQIDLNIFFTNSQGINQIQVFYYAPDGRLIPILTENNVQEGLVPIFIDANTLNAFGNPESSRGLQRIILYDGLQNVITYGDIMVQ